MNSMIVYLAGLQIFLLLLTLGIALVLLHKTRKIHLATYDLQSAGRETRMLFAQIQSLLALERKLGLAEPLPPMRGWVGSPDFLLRVANSVLERKPETVMECSSGVSTLVIARCLQIIGRGHVYSLEHDATYANTTRDLLARYGLSEWASVIDAPLQTEHTETPWYSERLIPSDLAPIDMLVVDGPPATTAPLARFPALPRLAGRMADRSLVIVDDASRPDEVEMVKRWRKLFPGGVFTDCYCEKGCVMLAFDRPLTAGQGSGSDATRPNSSGTAGEPMRDAAVGARSRA
ncbi:MAG: class I SAM-dependent methyltransferase [Rhodocyclaceae bacterium]|nr:class I SAM-dependent methyltransferase [Rhodocyclaceae bacterium]